MTGRPLRRVVIKEELVALTGDATRAILLNQFLYWQARVRDYDRFLLEELKRQSASGDAAADAPPLTNGWIYKSAEELGEEVMLGLSKQSILRRLDELVAAGWLYRRRNPKHAWDRTLQYRCDLQRIQADLLALGYHLDGWVVELLDRAAPEPDVAMGSPSSNLEHPESKLDDAKPTVEPRHHSREHRMASAEDRESTLEQQYQRALQRLSTQTSAEAPPEDAGGTPAPSVAAELSSPTLKLEDSNHSHVRRLLAHKRALGNLLDTLLQEDPSRHRWFQLATARVEAIVREGQRSAKVRGVSPATAVKELLDAAAQPPQAASGANDREQSANLRRAMAAAELEADARVDPQAMARLLKHLPHAAQQSTLANLSAEMRERVFMHLGERQRLDP